jgi:hypothetical protein
MAYYLRYISTDERPILLAELEAALKSIDPKYSIVGTDRSGRLKYGRGLYALLDVTQAANGGGDEIAELREEVEAIGGANSQQVLQFLDSSTEVLTLEVKWQSRSTDETLDRFGLLWEWLLANRQGLIQADGEGYYQGEELILDVGRPKARKRIGPPCPKCGAPLRSAQAKQCFTCGADWH